MEANSRTSRAAILVTVMLMLSGGVSQAQPATRPGRDALRQLNGSIAGLVKQVSGSVVQILVTSYGPVPRSNRADTDLVIGRQRSMGSGVVVDAGGYIMTNAHVVANARRVQVVLPAANGSAASSHASGPGHTVDAAIVGIAKELDLALLKIDGALSPPPLALADYDALQQGELVFAFGSPEGLANSVTMGIVSAVARQPDQDSPLVYVQTDAPINHGNSGGPLVNVDGLLVGITTFIWSESGGSQGLGFAIPSALVQLAYPKLRQYGHLHRGEVGILLQTITPALASGLHLPQDSGAMISDVAPESPAARAGLRMQDVVVSIDGEPVSNVPRLAFNLMTHTAGDVVRFKIRRGDGDLTTDVTITERAHDFDRLTDHIDPQQSLVAKLGILGVDVSADNAAMAASMRLPFGVIVVGRTDTAEASESGLLTGDTIHALNGAAVTSVAQLRDSLGEIEPRQPVVLQVERSGQIVYLAFAFD